MFMRIILIILALLFSSNLYSQPDGIFVKKDGVLVISNDLKTDRKNGYTGTSSNKARKLYNKAYDLSFTDVYKAIELYNEALDFDPYFVETYDNLGRLYRVVEDYNAAMDCYHKSIAIFPNGATAHLNLAVVYEMIDQYDNAINEYNFLIELNPMDPEGYYGLSNMYLYSAETANDLLMALENAEKALELYSLNPPSYIGDSYFQIGYIYLFLSEDIKADKYFKQAKSSYIENGQLENWHYKEQMINRARN